MKPATFSATLLFALVLLTKPVFAGGGLVSITSNTTELLNVGGIYTVTATAQKQDNTLCANCPIYFKFEEGSSEDSIIMLEPATNSLGQARAEVSSITPGNKIIFAVLTLPDGQLYESSRYILHFTPVPVPQVTPFPIPTIRPITISTFPLTIDKSRPVEDLKNTARQVFVSWSPVDGATYYNVKLRPADYSNWAIPVDSPTTLSSINLILSTDTDYYVQVDACNSSACVSSKETLIAKQNQGKTEEIKPLLGDKKIQDLERKIANLEQQVAETQKKQSFLESQIAAIFSFLKSLFRFGR